MMNIHEGLWIDKKWFEITSISKNLKKDVWVFDITFTLNETNGSCEIHYSYRPSKYRPSTIREEQMDYKVKKIELEKYNKIRKKTFEDIQYKMMHAIKYELKKSYFDDIAKYEEGLPKPKVEFFDCDYDEEKKNYILDFKFDNSQNLRKMIVYTIEFDISVKGKYMIEPLETNEESYLNFSSWQDYVWEEAQENSPLKLLMLING